MIAKSKRLATARTDGKPLAKVSAGQLDGRDAYHIRLEIQAAHLASRFGLTLPHAAAVAFLAFGEARA